MNLTLPLLAALLSSEPVHDSFSRPGWDAKTIFRSQSPEYDGNLAFTESVGRRKTSAVFGIGPSNEYNPAGPPVTLLTTQFAPNDPLTTTGPAYDPDGIGAGGEPLGLDLSLFGPNFPNHIEGTFHNGGTRQFTGLGLFVPLVQHPDRLLFADLRGKLGDDTAAEGNWGLGYRQLLSSGWIAGFYGFYDLRHTRHNNNFNQVTFGVELLDLNWDLRLNAYIPESGGKPVSGVNNLFSSNGTIAVGQGQERAYHGLDGEIGALLSRFNGPNYDAELRGFLGGFWFDNSASGFRKIAGPRVRLELRLFDLPWFGIDSRVVLGGEVQYDDVRGTQTIGTVTLRIPLGPAPLHRGRPLSPFERRFVAPIRRDIDVVTNIGPAAPGLLDDFDDRDRHEDDDDGHRRGGHR